MADEVEISNVGGRNGVASEATMQLLLAEFRTKISSDSQFQKAQAQARGLNTKALNENTKQLGPLAKSFKSATEATKSFIKEAAIGGDRLGDFASAVFGASSVLTTLVRFGDDTIDTLRGLTSVGASFNNSMFDMIAASANSAMNMGDFASLVQRNSQTLVTFGANVTGGARVLGEFSRDFRRGAGNDLFSMGFTIQDVNEGLINFLDLERRRSNASIRTDKISQQAAMAYVLELDKLTKLTGEERDQIAERMAAQVQDAGVRAQVNRLEGQARVNLQSGIAFLDSQLSGPLADALMDLTDGVAQTDVGKALANQVPGITAFAQSFLQGQVGLDELQNVLRTRVGPALENFSNANDKAVLDQLRGSSGVTGGLVSLADQLFRINQLQDRSAGLSEEEQEQRDKATATVGGFEQAVTDARKSFVDAFLDASTAADGLFDSFGSLMTTIKNIIAPEGVEGSIPSFQTALKNFMTNAFGEEGYVTKLVSTINTTLAGVDWDATFTYIDTKFNEFTSWIDSIITTYKSDGFSAALEKAGSDIVNTLLNFFLGKMENTRADGMGADRRVGGLFSNIYERLFPSASTGPTFFEKIETKLNDLLFPDALPGSSVIDNALKYINDLLFPDALPRTSVIDNALKYINELIYGTNTRPDGTGGRTGGILSSISQAVSEILSDNAATFASLSETISNSILTVFNERIPELLSTIINSARDAIDGGGANTTSSISGGENFGGGILGALTGIGQSTLDSDLFYNQATRGTFDPRRMLDAYNTSTYINRAYRELESSGQYTSAEAKAALAGALKTYVSNNYQGQQLQEMQGYLSGTIQDYINELPAYNIGTNGFENFGLGTPVMVHNEEAIVPRNSPAGEMLDSFYSGSQEQLANKVDQLNTTMLHVVKLLATGNQINEKTARGLRGMTTDFYRGAKV